MGKTRNTGYLQNIVQYDGSNNIILPSLVGTGTRMVVTAANGTLSYQDIPTTINIGAVPTTRTITINGTSQDLSANRTWTLYTDDISEDGSPVNLWFTNARARAAISVTGSGSYDSATGVITVTGGVTSVNTLTGAVTLTTTNIGEGTNLYYTTARVNSDFDTRLATKSTTNLAEGTNLYYTDARVGTYLTNNSYATQSYVSTQISNLVASAPATLDTLNELAAALGNDANFSTTISTALGNRLRVDINTQGLTSTQKGYGRTNLGVVIGTDVQAWDADLDAIAALSGTSGFLKKTAANTWSLDTTSYQPLLTNPITGSGTSGYISKFSGANALSSSILYATSNVLLIGDTTATDIQTKLEIINSGPVGLKIKSSGVNGNNTFLSIESSKEWRFLTNRGDLISGNQGDLIIRNNTDGINAIILNQSGASTFSSSVTASSLIKSGGTSAQFLMADGSVSTNPGWITSYTETDTLASVTGRGATTSTVLYFTGGSSTTPALHVRSGGNSWSEGIAIHPAADDGYSLTFYRTKTSFTDQTNSWGIGNMGDAGALNYFGLLRKGLTGSVADSLANAVFTVNPNGTFKFGFNPYVGSNVIYHAGNVPTWNQNTTGSAATLTTARTLTIGSTGKTFDGSANVSWSLSEIGALPSGIIQQGGKSYVTHDFNSYPTLYDVIFVNPSGSSNLPTGMSAVMSYRFIMGAGDTTSRGFDLVGAAEGAGNLYIRERSIGTWNKVWHSGNLTNLNQLTNGPGYITSYTETDTLASVTGRGASTSTPITVTASEGREVAVYMPSSYTTDDLVSGHEYGWYNDHWRLGMTRSGGVAGADFVVQWNAARRLSLTSGGNLTVTGTISASNFSGSSSGTNTGDQTNISGNAATATSATQVVTIQDTAPSTANGKLWWESTTGKLKVYYSTSSAWVDVLPMPDMNLYYAKAGGAITGNVNIQQSLTVDGVLNMNTSGTSYIRMGRFPQSLSNSGEAWIGRAADRSAGTMTVQLGGSSNGSYFEIVDHGWTTVTFKAGMNDFSYKGNNILHAGNYNSYSPTLTGGNASGTWSINVTGSAGSAGSATYADRIQTGNNQWTWSQVAHTATNPNTITLWDQYSNLGGAGNPVTYGTIVDIYGRSGHEHDQILMDSGGAMYHRNCFYGTNTWNGWRTMLDSSNYNSYSPTLTGGGASGTWSINITGGAGSANVASVAYQVVTIQDSPPSGSDGKLWWESDTGRLKVYYGTASAWIDAIPIPDMSLYYPKAGGSITGNVTVQQTLNVVGNTLVQGNINAFGDITAYSSSDIRLKDNITIIESPLDKVSKINGVSFNWNDKQSVYEIGKKDYGVIAQEVEEVLPELVTTRDNGYKAVRYEKIVPLLIESIKEQQVQISELKTLVNMLTDKLNNL